MSRVLSGIGLAFALVVLLVVTAAAQSGALAGLVQPLVVNVEQAVPVDITLAIPLESGEIVTVTTPITVGVALQVKIDGAQVVAVTTLGDAAEPAVTVAEPVADDSAATDDMTDNAGLAYTAQMEDGMSIVQIGSKALFDNFQIFGQLRNDSDQTYKYISIGVSLYDADGKLIDTTAGLPRSSTLAPGDTTIFEAPSMVDAANVASYELQIEGTVD